MAGFILFIDLIVFAIVIACAVSLVRGGAVHACLKRSETCGRFSMDTSTERENRLSAVFLMLPRLGRRAGQIQRPGVRPGRPQ
jgi:hypothetical protein